MLQNRFVETLLQISSIKIILKTSTWIVLSFIELKYIFVFLYLLSTGIQISFPKLYNRFIKNK